MKTIICETCKDEKKYYTKKICSQCYWRIYRRKKKGIDVSILRLRAKKGEGSINKEGYRKIFVKGHPNSYKDGCILEHTFVMSEHLKRPLTKFENVHHLNGNRLDNRIENLELWNRAQPPGQRVSDKIVWCIEFLQSYGYSITKSCT